MEEFKRISTGIIFILVPMIMMFGFAAHPNLSELAPPGNDVQHWISEFHGNPVWRAAHVSVLWAAVLIAVMFLAWMRLLADKAPVLSFVAGTLGIVGCFMLAADKGALALVPSAFDTLPEAQFQQLLPGLQAMLDLKGSLWMVRLYLLLPLGFVLMGIALVRTRAVPRWQGVALVLGGLLLFNPDIDLVSLVASIVLTIGLVPTGLAMLKAHPQQPHAGGHKTPA